jgi:hypothetical protein
VLSITSSHPILSLLATAIKRSPPRPSIHATATLLSAQSPSPTSCPRRSAAPPIPLFFPFWSPRVIALPRALPSPRVGPRTPPELSAACRAVGAAPCRWELAHAIFALPLPPRLGEQQCRGLPLSIPISRSLPDDPLVMLEHRDPLPSLMTGFHHHIASESSELRPSTSALCRCEPELLGLPGERVDRWRTSQ